ncbi:MAG TPA: lysophospholipid acyltransferase family protein [Tepidisphaeraceae bacterium]|nr:lysophospholipid acyltransferase family protein [Tepidisphaeraceae bacterium]
MQMSQSTEASGEADKRPDDVSEAANPILWDILQIPCRIVTSLMFDLKVYGREHIPAEGGALLLSNHQSNLDPVLLAVQLQRKISFIAKSELFESPFFSWLIRSLNAFPVRRGETDIGAIKEAIRRLREGRVLTMFPEGTRTRTGLIGKIQPGIAMLIRRAGVPVIPAVIDGSFEAWPRGQKLFHPYPIRVMYGPAMNVENLKGQQIVEVIDKTLREMLEQLRAKRGDRPQIATNLHK